MDKDNWNRRKIVTRRKCWFPAYPVIPIIFFQQPHFHGLLTLSQTTKFRPFKTDLADNNFKFDENGRKFSKGGKHCGKRRNCLLRAITPFLIGFSKDLFCRHIKTRACLGKS